MGDVLIQSDVRDDVGKLVKALSKDISLTCSFYVLEASVSSTPGGQDI